MEIYSPVIGSMGSDGGDVVHRQSTAADAALGEIRLAPASGQGALAIVRLPVYPPDTDLQPILPSDLPLGPDGHPAMPEEHWPVGARKPLLNVGGNRVLVAGQTATFSAHASQTDEDGLISACTWDFGDGDTATGMKASHVYDAPGTYTLAASTPWGSGTVETERFVRVIAQMGESDAVVTGLPELGGDLANGWHCTVEIQGDASDWHDFQGIALYIWDDTNVGWRDDYVARFRDLSQRTAYPAVPPPPPRDANPIGDHPGSEIPSGNLGNPSGGCWQAVNRWNHLILDAARKTGVPGNLGKAFMALESCGDPNCKTPTDNPDCPYAICLMQIAPGCSWFDHDEKDLWDPAQNILAGFEEIRVRYDDCGTWEGAVCAYFSGECEPDGETDSVGTEDHDYVRIVLDNWAIVEQAARTGSGGGAEPTPRYGEMLFNGYVTEGGVSIDPERGVIVLKCVGTVEMLDYLQRRQEAFFETTTGHTLGGTFMDTAPMRIAQCIHHTVTEHSNFARFHDVILDWSGPRIEATTANEGSMLGGFRAWAENDFAHVFSDRQGALRLLPQAAYRGKTWYAEAIGFAPLVDPGLVVTFELSERNLGERVTWVKFSGTMPYKNCQVYGEYPCGGPPDGPAGKWVTKLGFQYDDQDVLCAMAAHHYSRENRRYDASLVMPWRHDLELGDILRLPFTDDVAQGAHHFDWRASPRPFVVTALSHAYDTGTLMTTASLEELSYGVPCRCPDPECHTERSPCPTCPPPCPGCSPGGVPGSPNCHPSGTDRVDAWVVVGRSRGDGGTGVGRPVPETTGGGVHTELHVGCGCVSVPAFPFPCTLHCELTNTTTTEDLLGERWGAFGGFSIPPVDIEHVDPGEVGVLSAFRTDRRDVMTAGGASHNNGTVDDTVSWVEVTATGPNGSTLVGTITLTPRTDTQGGLADVLVLLLSDVEIAPVDYVVPPGLAFGDDALTGGTVIGTVEAIGVDAPTIGFDGGPVTFDLRLACHPAGYRYAIGLRPRPNPQPTLFESTTHFLELSGSGVLHSWERIVVDHGPCAKSCSVADGENGNPLTCRITDIYTGVRGVALYSGEEDPETWIAENGFCFLAEYGSCTINGCAATWTVLDDHRLVTRAETATTEVVCDVALAWTGCEWGANGTPGSPSHIGGGFGGGAVNGTCGNWPTAEAIDNRIAQSGAANGRGGPLAGEGATFLRLGAQYGVNPGFVTALLQRESQLGTDGSTLPAVANNFGGMTGASGPCGTVDAAGHTFIKFCSAAEGLAAIFDRLRNVSAYTNTDGSVAAILDVWAPCFENDCAEGLRVMAAVAASLGITLDPNTSIYTDGPECTSSSPIPNLPVGSDMLPLEWSLHQAGGRISQGPGGSYSHSNCDCYDFGVPDGTPMYPILPGTVIVSEATSGVYTPNVIVVQTAYGSVRYAHFIERAVAVGEQVRVDTLLGYSGTAGTGAHLHLGLDGGTSNYSLDELLQIAGFRIGSFGWSG